MRRPETACTVSFNGPCFCSKKRLQLITHAHIQLFCLQSSTAYYLAICNLTGKITSDRLIIIFSGHRCCLNIVLSYYVFFFFFFLDRLSFLYLVFRKRKRFFRLFISYFDVINNLSYFILFSFYNILSINFLFTNSFSLT